MLTLPFIIELIADWWLIRNGKKDLPLWLRIFMIAGVGIESVTLSSVALDVPGMALAVAPFAFFDNILAWMRGKRGLDYHGKTKAYDRFINRFNPRFLLVIRGLVFVGLVTFGLLDKIKLI